MKHVRKILFLSLTLVLAVGFMPDLIPQTGIPTQVEAAKISNKKLTLLKRETKKLTVKGTKRKVSWSSSKKAVASVSKKGKVTARSKGTATITAKVGKKKYSCTVTVETPSLNRKNATLDVGSSLKLTLTGTSKKVTWSSSKKSVATVSSNGKVSAKSAGTAIITAKVSSKKYKCRITVQNVSSNNNILDNASQISIPTTVESFLNVGQADYYCFTVSNHSIRLDMSLIFYMPYITVSLLDSNGQELDANYVSWNSNISQGSDTFSYYLDPGTYYIQVEPRYKPLSGTYQLTVSSESMDNDDLTYDNTLQTAHEINPNTSLTGVLSTTDTSDVYKITLAKPGFFANTLTAYMSYVSVSLLDENGSSISHYTPSWNSNIGFSINTYTYALEAGTYYLQIYSYSGYRGKYQLQNTFETVDSAELEKNDSIETATSINLGNSIPGLLATNESHDVFKVHISTAKTYNLELCSFMQYINLYVYRTNSSKLLDDCLYWDSNLGYGFKTYSVYLEPGDYYIQLSRHSAYRGRYQFKLS